MREGDRSHSRAPDLETTFQARFGGKDIQGQAGNSKRKKPLADQMLNVAALRESMESSNSPRERSNSVDVRFSCSSIIR
jgi:hypothetical protein